jgi:hypothetical protein
MKTEKIITWPTNTRRRYFKDYNDAENFIKLKFGENIRNEMAVEKGCFFYDIKFPLAEIEFSRSRKNDIVVVYVQNPKYIVEYSGNIHFFKSKRAATTFPNAYYGFLLPWPIGEKEFRSVLEYIGGKQTRKYTGTVFDFKGIREETLNEID